MLRPQEGVRVLGPRDLDDALALVGEDPVTNVFAEYRTRLTQLDTRWLGGEMWGYVEAGRLVSMCHVGANLVPVQAGSRAIRAFAERARRVNRRSSTIVGPRDAVAGLWGLLADAWPVPRDLRWDQPHLTISGTPRVPTDPRVRVTPVEDLELLYPACVAMYTEEVGISPEADGGRGLYRARVSQLVNRGWSFSRIDDGRVVFKAEVACATPRAAQIQGVYVDPELRGAGIGTAGMAAVVAAVRNEIAPVVSLYVNAHNTAARRSYEKVGFTQNGTFATIMF